MRRRSCTTRLDELEGHVVTQGRYKGQIFEQVIAVGGGIHVNHLSFVCDATYSIMSHTFADSIVSDV